MGHRPFHRKKTKVRKSKIDASESLATGITKMR
jgi:hypothetical protein